MRGHKGTRVALHALLACTVLLACDSPSRPPNVVLIVADDLGYGDLGVTGNAEVRTPRIDALAREGVRFSDAYVSAPLCAPMRAGLLTGRDANRFGYTRTTGTYPQQVQRNIGVPLSETLLPELLRRAGYATGAVGKWHLGVNLAYRPLARGFDSFFGVLAGAHEYFDWRGNAFGPVFRDGEPAEGSGYLTDAFADEAVRFVEAHHAQPFFLYVAFTAVHAPFEAPDSLVETYAGVEPELRRIYAAMVTALDAGVGRILDALEASGVADDTLVLFLSDNGGLEGLARNAPFRGGKGSLLEGGIRIPFFARWPGKLEGGRSVAEPVTSLDVFPTVVAAAGLPVPAGLDGRDLLPVLTGDTGERSLHWKLDDQVAVRRGDLKLVRYVAAPPQGKLSPRFELFDVRSDPGETRDLSRERAAAAGELRAELRRWVRGLGPRG